MARHRNIRNAKSFDYDYDEDDLYGHSFEEDYGVSPGTMAQYSYSHSRQRGNDFSSYMPSESTVQELEEENFEEADGFMIEKSPQDVFLQPDDKLAAKGSKNEPNEADVLLQSCIEMMHDVVGDNYTDQAMKEAVMQSEFDVERALNILLSSPKPNMERQDSFPAVGVLGPTAAAPLEQRQKRNRRADRNKADTEPLNVTQGSVAKVVSSGTPSKTGFQTTKAQPSLKNVSNSPRATKKAKMNTNNLESTMQSMKIIENGEGVGKGVPKPNINPDFLHVERSESASLTPNNKLSNKPVEENVRDFKKSKKAAELSAKYQERISKSKSMISMVVIGHVDAGKSTLMGHLLYQCGEVSKRSMHKYEQESRKLGKASFAYAWILDETGEERNRGVTMDVGLTRFETQHRVVTLMDAPGHRDFIPNMITGASQADVAVLVVNATTGEFEAGFDLGGQTREHSLLIRSLGIAQLAVAVNKLDTVEWSQERFNEIVTKLRSFLKQAGFKDSDVTYTPVSGLMGENLTKPATDPKLVSWYKGPCLSDIIDNFKPPLRPIDYPLRFCVTDVVRGQGTGINVSGKVETGGVKVGDKVIVLPAGEQSLVKGIEFHDGTKTDFILAGDHGTLTCHGVDYMKIQTGNVLSDVAAQIPVVSQFRARIIIFNIAVPITRGFPVELHYKAASEPAVIKRLLSVLHKSTGEVVAKKPKVVLKGQNVVVQMMVHRPICIEEYGKVKEMGRFTLRYGGSTIAAGVVTEVLK